MPGVNNLLAKSAKFPESLADQISGGVIGPMSGSTIAATAGYHSVFMLA